MPDSWKKDPKKMNLDQLKAYESWLSANGHGDGKEHGKVEALIISKSPKENYSQGALTGAADTLSRGVTKPGGWTTQNAGFVNANATTTPGALQGTTTTPGTSLSGTGVSGTSDLEKQLADKNAALVKATSNINDNPWYSEATRTGKLAKLNNIAQLDITNLQNAISQKKTDEQNAFNNNITTQNMALSQQKANQPNVSVVTNNDGTVTGYDSMTGKVMYTLPGAGASKTTGGGSTASEKQNYSSQMVDAISTIKTQTAAMGITYEGGGSYITINQAKPLIEEWTKLGFTENDWWNRFGSSVLGGKP
jgi:hypothetical protein